MPDLTNIYKLNDVVARGLETYLNNRRGRIEAYAAALDWVSRNKPSLNMADLLPPVTTPEGRAALARYERQVAGLGREIYQERLWGTIGTIGWGGNQEQIDAALEQLDLRGLATAAFTNLFTQGIAGIVAYLYQPPDGQPQTRLDILNGYLEPMVDPNNTSYAYGLLHIISNADGVTYRCRLYHYDQMLTYEWPRVANPNTLIPEQARTEPLIYPPRYRTVATDENGLPIGEVMEGLPLLMADVAKQVKIHRIEEGHAWPILHISEAQEEPKELGGQTIIFTRAGGRVERIQPGSVTEMQAQHDRLFERIRRRFALRASINLDANLSGVSIQEANQLALSAYAHYAAVLSDLLTAGVKDFGALNQFEAPSVTVEVNRQAYRNERIQEVMTLYKEGLISLDMALGEITKYIDFDPEDVQKFLEARGVATGTDVARLFGGEE